MLTIDTHAAEAEYLRLLNTIEDMDARVGDEYSPDLDDLQWEAAALRWQLSHA
ncbi:MAG: hypothetical protein ACLQVF_28280 [Isosphaeraceae bacterium]